MARIFLRQYPYFERPEHADLLRELERRGWGRFQDLVGAVTAWRNAGSNYLLIARGPSSTSVRVAGCAAR